MIHDENVISIGAPKTYEQNREKNNIDIQLKFDQPESDKG